MGLDVKNMSSPNRNPIQLVDRRFEMKYSEVAKISYGIIDAAPYGCIDTKEQYDYMVAFNNRSNFGFYWNDNDRHVPTYEECKGRYLDMTSFFGGASFFLCIRDYCNKWNEELKKFEIIYPDFNYGKYGKLELDK